MMYLKEFRNPRRWYADIPHLQNDLPHLPWLEPLIRSAEGLTGKYEHVLLSKRKFGVGMPDISLIEEVRMAVVG